jgi:L-methionine (R)-S-oxide reductase
MTFQVAELKVGNKREWYAQLASQVSSLLEEERNFIANAANFSALLYHSLPEVNWAGFYLYADGELVLGPFQGQPACVRIPLGKGVCGTAAQHRQTLIVPNVHQFPGHIACDSASNSEIVVPVVKDDCLLAILDLDSPTPARFDEEDASGLNHLVEIFIKSTNFDAAFFREPESV